MDGVLVNNTINTSIDNANRSGNVHQYFIKNLLIIITNKKRLSVYYAILYCQQRYTSSIY